MLGYRKCKILFKKTGKWDYILGTHIEIENSKIINTLKQIQKKYDFKIIALNLDSYGCSSKIIIKCRKKDKFNIVAEFCEALGSWINSIDCGCYKR